MEIGRKHYKMLMSIIKEEIVHNFGEWNLIKLSYHSLLKDKSCLTNLFMLFEGVTSRADRIKVEDVRYLDFQKAFNQVLHKRLCTS